MVTYERPTNWIKANNYKHLALNQGWRTYLLSWATLSVTAE